MKIKRVGIRLDIDLHTELKVLAAKRQTSVQDLMIELIRKALLDETLKKT